MIANVAAAVGGFVVAQPLITALYRLGLDARGVAIAVVVICAFGVIKGGLLRWAAAGVAVGYVGFHVVVAYALDKLDDGRWIDR